MPIPVRQIGNQGPEVKFGFRAAVSTTNVELWSGAGAYNWLTAADTLRLRAGGNVNDTAGGAGARSVVLEGISAAGAEIRETVATAGASASSSTTATFIRLNRAYVGGEGGDLQLGAGAHHSSNAGDINIETTGGTLIGHITATNGLGQTEQAILTLPLNLEAQLRSVVVTADGNTVDVRLCTYRGALVSASPYPAVRVSRRWNGRSEIVEDFGDHGPVFPPLSDVWLDVVRGGGQDADVSGTMVFEFRLPA